MRTKLTLLAFSTVLFLFTSCDSFSTATHTPQQIKKASSWSETDEPPTFESCQSLAQDEQFDCFKSTLTALIDNALYEVELVANQEIDKEIVLVIAVTQEGEVELNAIENADFVFDAIPSLSTVLEDVIASAPKAVPAVKTNVGVKVATEVKLPIRITASVSE